MVVVKTTLRTTTPRCRHFLVYSIFQCTAGRIQQVFRPAAVSTLPVGLYLVFRPPTLLRFFLYQKPSFVGLGSKCILQHGDLEFLLLGYILDMSTYVMSHGAPVFL